MSTATPNPGQSWQPAPQYQYQQPMPGYTQPVYQPAPVGPAGPSTSARASHPSVLHRWPTWAQNTALAVGAVAVIVIIFFAGYFTANAVDRAQGGFGTGQNFTPRQFGGNGNGFGGQSGNGFGGQSGNGSGSQSGSGNGS